MPRRRLIRPVKAVAALAAAWRCGAAAARSAARRRRGSAARAVRLADDRATGRRGRSTRSPRERPATSSWCARSTSRWSSASAAHTTTFAGSRVRSLVRPSERATVAGPAAAGIRFQDGARLDAGAVLANAQRWRDDASGPGAAPGPGRGRRAAARPGPVVPRPHRSGVHAHGSPRHSSGLSPRARSSPARAMARLARSSRTGTGPFRAPPALGARSPSPAIPIGGGRAGGSARRWIRGASLRRRQPERARLLARPARVQVAADLDAADAAAVARNPLLEVQRGRGLRAGARAIGAGDRLGGRGTGPFQRLADHDRRGVTPGPAQGAPHGGGGGGAGAHPPGAGTPPAPAAGSPAAKKTGRRTRTRNSSEQSPGGAAAAPGKTRTPPPARPRAPSRGGPGPEPPRTSQSARRANTLLTLPGAVR